MSISKRIKKVLSNPLVWLGAAGVGAAIIAKRAYDDPGLVRLPRDEAISLVQDVAIRADFDPRWALAWADLESGFKTDSIHDTDWPHRRCGRGSGCYEEEVLANPAYEHNPFLYERDLWVGYGLYALLSPYWLDKAIKAGLVSMTDPPYVLADPIVNVHLGVGMLKDLYARTGGDFTAARGIAKGCRADWSRCRPETFAIADARHREVGAKWGVVI